MKNELIFMTPKNPQPGQPNDIMVTTNSLINFLESREHYEAVADFKKMLGNFQNAVDGFGTEEGIFYERKNQ